MSGLQITITTAGYAALVNAQNLGTNPTLVAQIGITEQPFIENAGMTALPGELKRLTTFAGSAVADDTVHVTIRDDGPDTYSMRGFGLYLADGTLLAVYGQTETILEKSAQAMMLLAADIRFVDIAATELVFGDTNWINPPATTEVQGVLELATSQETSEGLDGSRGVTPAGMKAGLDSRFGVGAPSTFVKGLLSLATAALMRTAIGLGSAATRDEGAGKGLDADKLDGQEGGYYLGWGNQTGKPSTFPPSAHQHSWSDIVSGIPATATRWPSWLEVSEKPPAFPPTAHTHAWADIISGVPDTAKRWPALAEVVGLADALNNRVRLGSGVGQHGNIVHIGWDGGQTRITIDEFDQGPIAMQGWATNRLAERVAKSGDNMAGPLGINGAVPTGVFGAAVTGAVSSVGPTGGFGFKSRGGAAQDWILYAINGAAHLNLDGAGNLLTVSASGALSTVGGYDFGSSVKLKHIDGKLPYGLAEVVRMQTAIGRYRSEYNSDGRRRLFLLAEQLAELIPEAVDLKGVEFNGERVPAVKIEQLLPVFANAIKELSAIVRAQGEDIAKLTAAR